MVVDAIGDLVAAPVHALGEAVGDLADVALFPAIDAVGAGISAVGDAIPIVAGVIA